MTNSSELSLLRSKVVLEKTIASPLGEKAGRTS
jgi:hypothetical protein